MRVNLTNDGQEANDDSHFTADERCVSAYGQFVAFQSVATNLVEGDTNGERDVFLRDRGYSERTVPFLSPPVIGSPTVSQACVSAVMDHHLPWEGVPFDWASPYPYTCTSRAQCQSLPLPERCADADDRRRVLAFDAQEGDSEFGENSHPPGYRQESGLPFEFEQFDYKGCGMAGEDFLDYDGHPGCDFNLPGENDLGDPILAAADGWLEVMGAGDDWINAPCTGNARQYNSLRIVHDNGLETWYLHAIEGSECLPFLGQECDEGSPDRPDPGETVYVPAGATIAKIGSTQASSPHLHFEVRVSATQQPVDPFGCVQDVRDVDPLACQFGNLWIGMSVFLDDFESGDCSAWTSQFPPGQC